MYGNSAAAKFHNPLTNRKTKSLPCVRGITLIIWVKEVCHCVLIHSFAGICNRYSNCFFFGTTSTNISPPVGVYFTAFPRRFNHKCCISSLLPLKIAVGNSPLNSIFLCVMYLRKKENNKFQNILIFLKIRVII